MKAKINTKSNYKGLNGQCLEVKEISGTRVTCIYFSEEFQKDILIDFTLKEISDFDNKTSKFGFNSTACARYIIKLCKSTNKSKDYAIDSIQWYTSTEQQDKEVLRYIQTYWDYIN